MSIFRVYQQYFVNHGSFVLHFLHFVKMWKNLLSLFTPILGSYLDLHNQKVQAQHASPVPIRQPDEFSEVRTIPPVQGPVPEQYFQLFKTLSDKPLC